LETLICLIRHGETAWNTERRIQGHTDIALNETGIGQAQAAASWLSQNHPSICHVYSSDLSRAWITASMIAEALTIQTTANTNLRERRYGCFEGLTYRQADETFPNEYHAFESRDPNFAIPNGGESLVDLYERVTQALQTIAQAHLGETIAIVCHGGVLDIVNRFVRQNKLQSPRDFEVPNAGLNWISFHPQKTPNWRIEDWGNTLHLQQAALNELPH
jgi:2,3-bisphosphoglycerate-dependent phosphoglycerate mutase